MSNDVVIKVENLSKRYRLGLIGGKTLKEDVQRWWAKLRGQPDPLLPVDYSDPLSDNKSPSALDSSLQAPSSLPEHIWALKDINFEVKRGEILGIIGKNGAGKSTLLKIISKITAPTSGAIKIKGRIGSLLEVGTGFHPELTGRENIYLNGAILGMTKTEVDRKIDEIIEFAEIRKYIDTPVKRYSSGMYVRLAFAVAAHLEPEILLIDEVLAVGDVGFQKKCLGKMGDVAGEGRTVLFVSHNMQAVRNLCPRSILLDEGKMITDAPTSNTLLKYYKTLRQVDIDAETAVNDSKHRRGSGAARFINIAIQNEQGQPCSDFIMGSTIRFRMSYQVFEKIDHLFASVALRSGTSGEFVTSAKHKISDQTLQPGHRGITAIEFPNANLRPGEYALYFWIGNKSTRAYDVIDDLVAPLMISTNKDFDELGFDPTVSVGYFNIKSKLI